MSFCTVPNDRKLQWLLRDIFPDAFMQRHTNFPSFQVFCYSSSVIVNWTADPMVYDETLLDCFVRESTEFSDWETMVRCAADERFSGSVQGELI